MEANFIFCRSLFRPLEIIVRLGIMHLHPKCGRWNECLKKIKIPHLITFLKIRFERRNRHVRHFKTEPYVLQMNQNAEAITLTSDSVRPMLENLEEQDEIKKIATDEPKKDTVSLRHLISILMRRLRFQGWRWVLLRKNPPL